MRRMRCLLSSLAFLALAAVAPAPGAAAEWRTFGYDAQRTGYNPSERKIDLATAPNLRIDWISTVDGQVVAQPTVGRFVHRGVSREAVYIATANGELYALRASDGSRLWQRSLGSTQNECANSLEGQFGITGTPYLDSAHRRLFVVTADGMLHAIDMATGSTKDGWPIPLTDDPANEHSWSAVNLNFGRLYATLGGYCDERTPHHGKVLAVSPGRRQVVDEWRVTGPDGPSGGSINGFGGVSIDPDDDDLHVATDSALGDPPDSPFAERVVRLRPTFRVKASDHPVDPVSGDGAGFSTTPVPFEFPGCPPQLVVMQRSGALLLYDRDRIAEGPVQRIQMSNPEMRLFTGVPAVSRATRTIYVGNPADSPDGRYRHGLVALEVGEDCRAQLAWRRPSGENGAPVSSPIVAGEIAYHAVAGEIRAYSARTGTPRWRSGNVIQGAIATAPTVVGGRLYAAALDQFVYAFSPRRPASATATAR